MKIIFKKLHGDVYESCYAVYAGHPLLLSGYVTKHGGRWVNSIDSTIHKTRQLAAEALIK